MGSAAQRCRLVCLLLPLLGVLSCRDNQLGIDKRIANQAPQTQISSGPRDGTTATAYRVSLSWWGTDADGVVDHYEFILIDHPRSTEVTPDNPLTILVPEVEDPRWVPTSSTDTLIVTLADTLRRDPEPGPGESPDDVRSQAFERWHTFFIRAVDNTGTPDATPDYLSFNAKNFAPTVGLQEPARPGAVLQGAPAIQFFWDGDDPDGSTGVPLESRWVLIESATSRRSNFASWPDSLYTLPERYSWSPWTAWDAPDGSGTSAIVQSLLRVGERDFPPSGYYIFAVQARDEGGAITTVFDRSTHGKNNSVLISVTGPAGPRLYVDAGPLGVYQFIGTGNRVRLEAAYEQPIQMHWLADAEQYGGRIEAYRYGWNLINPGEDEGWDQSWSSSARSMPVHAARDVLEYFYLETRDTAGLLTSAVFEVLGTKVTRGRDVLWVDDTHELSGSDEIKEDNRWVETLSLVAAEGGFVFAPELDVWDVDAQREPPPSRLVFDYKTVVWSVANGWGLSELARFVDPFTEQNGTPQRFNYLKIYLQYDGNLWINGEQPAKDLWPQARHAADNHGYLVNVTHWDDPLHPHPLSDSAGTSSLLYDFGIEMFDIGAATGSNRSHKDQFCYSLDRTTPDGVSAQSFTTTPSAGHAHELSVENALVDQLNPAAVTLQTSVVEGHQHDVGLSGQDIAALQAGRSIHLMTAEAAAPQTHVHEVDIQDGIGRWGAPFLILGAEWQPAPGIGRPNIEIYNMPGALSSAIPPMRPIPGKAVAIYEYGSGLKADPAIGRYYPQTADRQPVFILARKTPTSPTFSRAFCSFRPALLHPWAQQWLTEYVLIRHFGLGTVP